MNELRHAVRALFKRPAFAFVGILTLALGIGANTAIFSIIDGVMLRPLPFDHPDRIVQLKERNSRGGASRVSHPNFLDWRQRATSFEGMSQYGCDTQTVLGPGAPRFAQTCVVSEGFFHVMGVTPPLGRTFAPEEMREHGVSAIVVSHRFWVTALGSNIDLSSISVKIFGRAARVVGVMPDGFDYPDTAEVWIPSELESDDSGRTSHNWTVVARLKPGLPIASAASEMETIGQQLKRQYGNDENGIGVVTTALKDVIVPPESKSALILLLGTVGLVLLIACANVATTLLARGEERRTEMAVRAALGARRGRLVRQLLVESSVLSVLGATAGLLLAEWLMRVLRSMNSLALPRRDAIGVDANVLIFTVALAVITPLVFGLLPSLQASRTDLRDALAEGGRSAAPARAGVRTALVIGEVAIALVLLVGSALLIRSFARVMSVDPGFDPTGAVTADMAIPLTKYEKPEQAAQFYVGLIDRLRALPGVAAAGAASQLPLGKFDPDGALSFEGHPDAGGIGDNSYDGFKYSAGYKVVSAGYFEALGIHLIQGRFLKDADGAGQPAAAVVSESFVKRFIPRVDPLGVRFKYAGMDPVNPVFTIVGVVGDVHFQSLTRAPVPQVYVPLPQAPFRARFTTSVVVRAANPRQQAQVAAALRDTLRQYDPDVPIDVSSMDAMLANSVADRRMLLTLVAAFAGLALMLAATGIFSVLSQAVAQRRSEIGIRMALGADASNVIALMLRSAMTSVLAGAAIGLAAAVVAVRVLRSFLFDVTPLDPAAFAMSVALLVLVALIAAYVPARRATRVDPLDALRVQ
jgi:predicted permease